MTDVAAYGETVWFWHPWLMSSCRWRIRSNRINAPSSRAAIEAERIQSPGRARHKPSNHCAGNAGVLRLYLYARVRISMQHCTRDRGCSKHPAFPAPSHLRERNLSKPRAQCVARTRTHTHCVGAKREATHSRGAMVAHAIGRGVLDTRLRGYDDQMVRHQPPTTPAASPKSWRSRGGPSARSPGSCADRRC